MYRRSYMELRGPEIWDEEIDVAVVGSGFAGLAAAAEAAGIGADVLVLEKMRRYGGNSLISGGGYSSWDSGLHLRQRLNLGDDTWQAHMEDTLKAGDYYNVPVLVERMVKGAPESLDWLIGAGAKIRETLPRIGGHSANRIHLEAKHQGRGFTGPLKTLALNRGAQIRTRTEVTHLWRKDADAPVEGIEIKTGDTKQNIKVKRGLILASGGFAADVEMRMSLNPSLVPDYGCTNHRGATGEIIRYARAVWADVLHLEFIQLYPCAEPEKSIIDLYALIPYSGTGYGLFYVNRRGERFVNELERRDVVSQAQIMSGHKPTYGILNRVVLEKLATSEEEIRIGVTKGRLLEAASVSGLARKLGISPETMEETMVKHNLWVRDVKDPEFNKPMSKNMVEMTEGPFYAIPQWPAIHFCMGGLRIDQDAHVIDIWGRPIPRLYAAGEVAGGVHGSNRLGGNAILDCIVFGRIAGINAAMER
jgi:urocanate reductase